MLRRGGRRVAILAAPLVVITMVLWGGLSPAAADEPDVIALDPAARAQTDVPPSRVTVAFTDNVKQDSATIVVKNSAGSIVSGGSFVVEGNNIYVDLDYNLPRGTYSVQYRATTVDGVPFGGSYQFAHGPGSFTDSAFSSWSGATDIPDDVRLPGDPDPADRDDSSSAAPDDDATDPAPDDVDGGVDTTDHGGDPDEDGAADESSSSSAWWWLLALVLALLAAASAAVVWGRRSGEQTDDSVK